MALNRPIKIAITAMGGQGGGVLADWIVALAESQGFIAQSTSVPGVAQRTGSTVYYIEIFPADLSGEKAPVLALMPVPGDVDIVIASELMEAGRALARGFVTRKTTLIASSHRVYAIGEKINLGDGRITADGVVDAAQKTAGRFVAFDMDTAATQAGSVISSVLFGALAGSHALPFARDAFERIVRDGRSAEANLAGFALGFDAASNAAPAEDAAAHTWPAVAQPSRAAQRLLDLVRDDFPGHTHAMLKEGLKRLVDYQGRHYALSYLDHMRGVLAADKAAGGERRGYRLTRETARYLALAMSYEDALRVADLKIRSTRFARVREDVKASPGQIVTVREYLHPRVEEIADVMPAPLGATVLHTKWLRGLVQFLAGKGRRVSTTKLRGFLQLWLLSSLRWARPLTYRAKVEKTRIDTWLSLIRDTAATDYDLACEIAGLQRLIKGYGETHERGLANTAAIMAVLEDVKAAGKPAAILHDLRDAALADDTGAALEREIEALRPFREFDSSPSLEKGGPGRDRAQQAHEPAA